VCATKEDRVSDKKDDRKKDKSGHGDRASKERGEPGGENPESHPFDKEVHPADESARSAIGKRSKDKTE
jgi:hypothetical protein